MKYDIQFCTTVDGVRLAYCIFGEGPSLVVPPAWISVINLRWENSQSIAFWSELAKYFTVLLYDKHGCGLSDRNRTDFSFEKEVRDLETIIEHAKFNRTAFFGHGQGGPIAIAYAAKYPEQVSNLILFSTFRSGKLNAPPETKAALHSLIKANWGLGSKTIADLIAPDADDELLSFLKRFQREAATPDMAVQLLKAEDNYDVTDLLSEVKAPSLVIHRRGDRSASAGTCKELAALIPGAKFLQLDGKNSVPWLGDSQDIVREIIKFCGLEGLGKSEASVDESMSKIKSFKRKLAAILSADVEGYSRLMGHNEEQTIRTLTSYRTVISDFVQKYRGRVVDTPGDNILAEFSSVVDAVNSSVKIQTELAERNAELPMEQRMQFRIGINLGDVVEDEERIYGDGVNIAARVESMADAGGICISGTVYDQVETKLEWQYEYLGEKEVKNISRPVRVYRLLIKPESSIEVVSEERMNLPLPDKPSIAVLPFDNMSGDPSQEYFSDGLTEQIISGLCKVDNLFVIARNSSFAYKGKAISIKQIAKELGVKYILEGSVQKAGNRLRITTQLIDATTEFHIWSNTYDRNLSDIFALQDEITIKLIYAMEVNLTAGEQARLWEGGTSNINAYEKCMKGLEYIHRLNKKDIVQARHFLEEAAKLDEGYAMPLVWLGLAHFFDIMYGWSVDVLKTFDQANKSVTKALSLNDSLDVAHALHGTLQLYMRAYEKALEAGEKAIALNPNGAHARVLLAITYWSVGKSKEAVFLMDEAFRLNPIPLPLYYPLSAMAHRFCKNFRKAIEMARKGIDLQPSMLFSHLVLAASCVEAGMVEDAKAVALEAMKIDPNFSVKYYASTLPYKNQRDIDAYTNALRQAGLPD